MRIVTVFQEEEEEEEEEERGDGDGNRVVAIGATTDAIDKQADIASAARALTRERERERDERFFFSAFFSLVFVCGILFSLLLSPPFAFERVHSRL